MSNIAAEQKFKRIEGGLPPSFEEMHIPQASGKTVAKRGGRAEIYADI